jgi:hypothetical protein
MKKEAGVIDITSFSKTPKNDEERQFSSMVISLMDDFFSYHGIDDMMISKSKLYQGDLVTTIISKEQARIISGIGNIEDYFSRNPKIIIPDVVILPSRLLYNSSEERFLWFDMKNLGKIVRTIDAKIRKIEELIKEEETLLRKLSNPEYWKNIILEKMNELRDLQDQLCNSIERRNDYKKKEKEVRDLYEGKSS